VGAKLSALIALLLVASVVTLVSLSNRLFVEDNTALLQQMNSETAGGLAKSVRELFERVADKAALLASLAGGANPSKQGAAFARDLLGRDDLVLSVVVLARAGGAMHSVLTVSGPGPADAVGWNEALVRSVIGNRDLAFEAISRGEAQVARVSLPDRSGAVVVAVPFLGSGQIFSHVAVAVVRQERLQRAFGENDLVTTFLVDRRGRLLAHPEREMVDAGTSVIHLPIVQDLMRGRFHNGQSRYEDPETGDASLGAFRVVGFAGLGVVAEVPEAKAFEAAHWVKYRAILVAVIVLCASVLVGQIFSESLTAPLYELARAAARIARGDFHIELKARARDEVGYLSLAFNAMAKGLEERDRVKETFRKFHNKEVADRLLSGDVKLGGERKQAAVLFVDIRNFTAMSEQLAPEAVVESLNEYLSRMVAEIVGHGGIVDKYVGDAILAVWGVPIEQPDDCERALRACLAIRTALVRLNSDRAARDQPPLYIGMGLVTGAVTAGNIGSTDRMEYTVIGDTVNTASRVESLTKQLGVDLLVDRSVRDPLEEKFLYEPAGSVRVRGKEKPLELFTVVGYRDEAGNEVRVDSPWAKYTAVSIGKAA